MRRLHAVVCGLLCVGSPALGQSQGMAVFEKTNAPTSYYEWPHEGMRAVGIGYQPTTWEEKDLVPEVYVRQPAGDWVTEDADTVQVRFQRHWGQAALRTLWSGAATPIGLELWSSSVFNPNHSASSGVAEQYTYMIGLWTSDGDSWGDPGQDGVTGASTYPFYSTTLKQWQLSYYADVPGILLPSPDRHSGPSGRGIRMISSGTDEFMIQYNRASEFNAATQVFGISCGSGCDDWVNWMEYRLEPWDGTEGGLADFDDSGIIAAIQALQASNEADFDLANASLDAMEADLDSIDAELTGFSAEFGDYYGEWQSWRGTTSASRSWNAAMFDVLSGQAYLLALRNFLQGTGSFSVLRNASGSVIDALWQIDATLDGIAAGDFSDPGSFSGDVIPPGLLQDHVTPELETNHGFTNPFAGFSGIDSTTPPVLEFDYDFQAWAGGYLPIPVALASGTWTVDLAMYAPFKPIVDAIWIAFVVLWGMGRVWAEFRRE